MAFNWQIFKTRTLTAAVFVVVMMIGLAWNKWSFLILFSIIHFGCWIEYQKLVGLIDKRYQQISWFHKYGVMIAGCCIMLYFTSDVYHFRGLQFHEIGKWGGLFFLLAIIINDLLLVKIKRPKNIGHSIFGLVYISLSWGLMINLYEEIDIQIHDTMYVIALDVIPFAIILSIWINDTMAYIIGSLIGKTPISKVSPKKTWEGTIGGIILCITVMALLFPLFLFKRSDITFSVFIAIIAAITAIAGTFGDLLESKLKRMAGVKDSGTLMPGHGGFLDRFDSMLLAIPAVWLYVYFFIK